MYNKLAQHILTYHWVNYQAVQGLSNISGMVRVMVRVLWMIIVFHLCQELKEFQWIKRERIR